MLKNVVTKANKNARGNAPYANRAAVVINAIKSINGATVVRL